MTASQFILGWEVGLILPRCMLSVSGGGCFFCDGIIHWLFCLSNAAPCWFPHWSALFARAWSDVLTALCKFLAVKKATLSIKLMDIEKLDPSTWRRREELYRICNTTKRGEPWGRPIVSCLGSKQWRNPKRSRPFWNKGMMLETEFPQPSPTTTGSKSRLWGSGVHWWSSAWPSHRSGLLVGSCETWHMIWSYQPTCLLKVRLGCWVG